MKVLIFTQFFPPEMEPSGFMFHSLTEHLAQSADVESVDVVCGFPNFPLGRFSDKPWHSLSRKTEQKGANIHNVIVIPSDNTSNIKRIANYTSYLISSTVKGLFIKSPDVVIATSPPIFAALSGLIIAKLKKAKFVLDVRDIWPESAVQMGSLKNGWIVRFLEFLEVTLYKNASLITVATPGMVDLVKGKMERADTPVEYVPCGVNIPNTSCINATGTNPFEYDDHNKFRVLYAGLHGYAQNLTTIIDAAKLLRKRDDIVFYFIGAGPDKQRVMSYAVQLELPNVKFLEPVDRDSIRRYLAFSGCAIVPLRDLPIFKNVFPSKTFELMSYGVPSIVGVGGEIAQVIKASGAGQAVQPENAQQYADAIERYASDDNYRTLTKERALNTAKAEFDYEVVNKRFEKLIFLTLCKKERFYE